MESKIETVFIKMEDEGNDTENFVCNFCCTNFATIMERDQHLETHLIRQNCSSCKKPMVLIGNQLYELHIPTKCTDELSHESSRPAIKIRIQPKRSRRNVKPLTENKNTKSSENNEIIPEAVLPVQDVSETVDTADIEVKVEPEANANRVYLEDESPTCNPAAVSESPSSDSADKKSKTTRKKSSKTSEKTYKKKYPKTIPCDMCDEKFGVNKSLVIHQKKVHNKVPVFKCDISGVILKTSLYLKNHIAIHSGEKRYICSYCGKRFHVSFRLKEHIYQHTGEKPYKYTLCDKTFGRTSLRKVHMRVHTGEKPFKCNVESCDRAYAHTSDLKRHRRSAHGIILKTFECPICSKIFYENKFLTKHLNVHKEQI